MENLRKANMHDLQITTASGKDVRDTKQLSGEATKDTLSGENVLKEHSSGSPVMGSGATGGKPYARK